MYGMLIDQNYAPKTQSQIKYETNRIEAKL